MRTVSLLLLCLLPALAVAQGDPGRADDDRSTFSVWSGVSFESPGWWGAVRGREFFILGVRWRHTMARSPTVSLAYTFDMIPLAMVTKTPARTRGPCCTFPLIRPPHGGLPAEQERIEPGIAYGFGVAPLGFQLELFRENPVYLVVGLAGGAIWFDREMPDLQTRRMNFSVELGASLRYPIKDHWELTVGYKFHHLSNGGTGTFNPGLDANVFYLGWGHR